ncbi:MAG: VCBS repeat-containing protein, partial [Planctomycetales bacterium]|nr:VCBS repeat-containing protein [Planctomycetales bacterium]
MMSTWQEFRFRWLAVLLAIAGSMCSSCGSRQEVDSIQPAVGPSASPPTAADVRTAPHNAATQRESPEQLPDELAVEPVAVETLVAHRDQLDRELWSSEVDAQRHEQVFVQLWDELRGLNDPFEILGAVSFDAIDFSTPVEPIPHELSIRELPLRGQRQRWSHEQWRQFLTTQSAVGYEIRQSEWHHSRFRPATAVASAESIVSFAIDCTRAEPPQRLTLRGNLRVTWQRLDDATGPPRIDSLHVENASVWLRDAPPAFEEIVQVRTNARHRRLMPILVKDLDGNGGSDILLGGLSTIYWNDGKGHFDAQPMAATDIDMFDAAVLANFAGDSHADLLYVGTDRRPMLLIADANGHFTSPPQAACETTFEFPKAFTAGDIDGDGDNDVW